MKVRLVLSSLVAVLALGAVTASAAEAVEAPRFKVAGVKLGEGQSKEITSTAGKVELGYGLYHSKCSTVIAPGGKIFGSGPGNPGTGELELEFTNCVGNRECALSGSFKTKPLELTLGGVEGTKWAENRGELAALLKPKSGFEFLRVISSSKCPEVLMGGELAVTIDHGDKLGEEKPEAKTVELTMPYEDRLINLVKGGVAKEEAYGGLVWDAEGVYLAGSVNLELASGENWGVFQKH